MDRNRGHSGRCPGEQCRNGWNGSSGELGSRLLALGMCGVSPVFVTFLLLKVSGVPLSENKYDKKYGDRKDYQEWKKTTPMFIPKL
jgi:hypothetical protein